MKKQYFVQKVVMAENVEEAIRKARKAPVHEVFVHNDWLKENSGYSLFSTPPQQDRL